MVKIVTVWLLALSFQRLLAQDQYTLAGKVTDSTGIPLYPATVELVTGRGYTRRSNPK